MKKNNLSIFLIMSLYLISCNENPNLLTINKTFMELNVIAGAIDSCEYYEYNPAYISYPKENLVGTAVTKDLLDLDNDQVYDLVIERGQNYDTILGQTYHHISVQGMNEMVVFNHPKSDYHDMRTIPYNTNEKIGTHGYWNYVGNLTIATSEIINETIQYDTCCGLWNERNKDYYLGISRTYPDTLVGWVRIEIKTNDQVIVKDCAIKTY